MDDLVEWLKRQLDDDERELYLAGARGERWPHPGFKWLIRDIDAKRRIIGLTSFDAQFPDSEGGYDSACEDVIKLLAEGYDQRPGYQESWRP